MFSHINERYGAREGRIAPPVQTGTATPPRQSVPAAMAVRLRRARDGAADALGPMPEQTLRCLLDLGMSNGEIARYFRLPTMTILRLRRRLGITPSACAAAPPGVALPRRAQIGPVCSDLLRLSL